MNGIERDAHLIDALGGPTKVAALLGWVEPGAIQRVSNWKRRGIPHRVRLENIVVFSLGAESAPGEPVPREAALATPQPTPTEVS